MSLLVPGDTLIGNKQFVEAALVLSHLSPKSLLFPILSKHSSLKPSLAFFIESLVLHERIFCTFSEDIYSSIISQTRFSDLSDLLCCVPFQLLLDELENQKHPELANIQLGYETVNTTPSILVDPDTLKVFNIVFPDLAREQDLAREVDKQDSNKWRSYRRSGQGRHFLVYETQASLAIGISYSMVNQANLAQPERLNLPQHPSGYKIYGDKTLTETRKAAELKAGELNEWLERDYFSVEAPIVFSYVLEKAKGKQDLLKVALDIRHSREARAFREQCILFDQATKRGDDKSTIEMIDEVKEKASQLQKKVSGPKFKFDVSFPLSITINPTEVLELVKLHRKRHLVFISHLYTSAISSRSVYSRLSKLL